MKSYEQHFQESCALRDTFWKSIGNLHPDVMAPILNPSLFGGGPMWPSVRQAFATIQMEGRTVIATDGLSDPYNDMKTNPGNAPYNGFGVELYMVTDNLPDNTTNTWQFQLINQIAQLAAQKGDLILLLEEMTYITTELYDVDAPGFMNKEGRVGVILGIKDVVIPDEVQLTLEPVKMVNVKLLTLNELQYVLDNGSEGRNYLAGLFLQQDRDATLSSLSRESVI